MICANNIAPFPPRVKPETVSFYRYFPISRRDKNWGLYVTTAGESRIAPHASYPPTGHPKGFDFNWQHGRVLQEFALVYISRGRGTFESGQSFSAIIGPGEAFLIFPKIWHRYRPDPEIGWHEHWIGFDGENAHCWLRQKFISPKNPLIKIQAEDTVIATFSRMMQTIRANRPALQQILAGATASLLGLIYSAQQTQPAADTETPSAIELAISRIHSEFQHDLNMETLAQELGVSYTWFRRTFAMHSGLTPHQYLLELRIIRARELLTGTNLSVKEIAMQTGFEDEHYFSRLFRNKLNLTPSQWRDHSRRHR